MSLWDRNFDDPIVGDTALLAEMHRNGILNSGVELDYASGLANGSYRGLRTVGHDGADAGFRSSYMRFPDHRFAVMVFANLSSFDANLLARQIADLLLGALMKPTESNHSNSTAQKSDYQLGKELHRQYLGEYYCPELGVIYRILDRDGGLVMEFPKGTATLQPMEDDVFDAHPVGQMNFERQQGEITGFRLDNGRVRHLLYEFWQR